MRISSTNYAAHRLPRLRSARAVEKQRAQTLVFFVMSLTVILLLCGFAIDSGLLYLAKARISRAVDGAALAAVGNFHQADTPLANEELVASTLRNFAAANYTDLANVGTITDVDPKTGAASLNNVIQKSVNSTTVSYLFFDPATPAKDANGAYRRYVQVTLTTGAGGQIVSAQCNARCPVHTYFISLFGQFGDLKVSSSAQATRSPRLIMVVVDRSGSMLAPPASGNPGCDGLPGAIVTFLNFFDTSSDYIGMVSFSSNARLEIPLTTNFLYAATNDLYEAYDIDVNAQSVNGRSSWYVPGPDPESSAGPSYYTSGIRRFRFGGQTAADEGIRLALEQMMANSGWSNPDVVKYMVIFTDGAWNTTRTLVAAPGYTNIVTGPPAGTTQVSTSTQLDSTNLIYAYTQVPAMAPWLNYWSAVGNSGFSAADHQYDIIQSMGSSNIDATAEGNSYLSSASSGTPQTFVTNTFLLTTNLGAGNVPIYTTSLNVWLPPGSVDYVYRKALGSPYLSTSETTVSEIENPTKTVNITLGTGDSNMLVVPGYLIDGVVYDGLDLPYPQNDPAHPYMRTDNYLAPWMWPDAGTVTNDGQDGPLSTGATTSVMRQLMFRNYMNLLTGFYVFRPDDPLETVNAATGVGTEPLTGAPRPLNPVGPYYPSAAFYWPFGSSSAPVGLDQWPYFALVDPTQPDPSHNGMSRAIAYSINMLSSNAAPEWSGELFYGGQNGVNSGATSQSSLLTNKAEWQAGMPTWIANAFDHEGYTTITESAHNTNQLAAVKVWRPLDFNGSNVAMNNRVTGGLTSLSPSDNNNYTGGYVQDGAGNIYRNTMAWSGRPTHYYDFSRSTWVPIGTNHVINKQMLPLGNWKAKEYCWHARAAGVTIYTVGYGTSVTDDEQLFLAELANATNTTGYGGTNFLPQNYNTQQPIGQQFYATTPEEIGADFSSVAKAINAALTQ